MSQTYVVASSRETFPAGSPFPSFSRETWVYWRQAAADHEGAAIAVNAESSKFLEPHEFHAAYVCLDGEELSTGRTFWFFRHGVRPHESTDQMQSLRIAQLEAELQRTQAELAAQKERALEADLQRQLAGHSGPPGLPFTHSGVSVPQPGVMRFENVVLNRSIGPFGPGERFRAAIATQTTIRFLEIAAPYEWRCSYRAQVAMSCGELVFHESDEAAAVRQ